MDIELTTKDRETTDRRWFGIGHKIDARSVDEVLDQAFMGWTVDKRPCVTVPAKTNELFMGNPKPLSANGTPGTEDFREAVGRWLDDPTNMTRMDEVRDLRNETTDSFLPHYNEFSIVRNDTQEIFGTAGRIYEVLDNEQCIEMLKPLFNDERIVAERAGTFDGGARCWVMVKFPESITIGADVLDQYMKLSWSHNGTEKLSATFIALNRRDNTQINPEIDGARVSIEIRHTTNAADRIALAMDLLASRDSYFTRLEEALEELVNVPWTDSEMESYLEVLIPNPKSARPDSSGVVKATRAETRRNEVLDIFERTDPNVANTKYAAFNAVAHWCDYDKGVRISKQERAEGDAEKMEQLRLESRAKSVWMKAGSGLKMKNKAFNLIVK